MKNILNKIYIHPFTIICLLIFILIGKFRFISYFMILIIIHEIGHIIVSSIFKWNIDKIIILPFGGLVIYNELINRRLIEEFLISISGIIFQMVIYLVIKNYIDYIYFNYINYFIIIFNILPIYPLDGSKILNVIFNILFSYKYSLYLTIFISYIFIVMLSIILININILFILILLFLLLEVIKINKNINLIFNKFILERYINKLKFNKSKIINNISKMKRDYRHIFYINNKYYTEKDYLISLFDNK